MACFVFAAVYIILANSHSQTVATQPTYPITKHTAAILEMYMGLTSEIDAKTPPIQRASSASIRYMDISPDYTSLFTGTRDTVEVVVSTCSSTEESGNNAGSFLPVVVSIRMPPPPSGSAVVIIRNSVWNHLCSSPIHSISLICSETAGYPPCITPFPPTSSSKCAHSVCSLILTPLAAMDTVYYSYHAKWSHTDKTWLVSSQ